MTTSGILPKPGDVIYTKRNKHTSFGIPWPEYKHYGVYIGDYQVIHFSGSKGHETDANLAEIIQTSLRGFLKGAGHVFHHSGGFRAVHAAQGICRHEKP